MSNLISSDTVRFSNQPVYTLTDLSNAVKRTMEANFEIVRVRGEISRPAFPNSGHVYFSLKDTNVSLASVIWKGQINQINIQPEEGMDVICTGKLTTLKRFIEIAFKKLDLDWEEYVTSDKKLFRETEIEKSVGDPKKIFSELGWKTKISVDSIIERLIDFKERN